jgi:hypothetical protein
MSAIQTRIRIRSTRAPPIRIALEAQRSLNSLSHKPSLTLCRVEKEPRGDGSHFFFAFRCLFLAGAVLTSAVWFSSRMRSNNTDAGSSFESCGTNSPQKALARMDWSRWVKLLGKC